MLLFLFRLFCLFRCTPRFEDNAHDDDDDDDDADDDDEDESTESADAA